jgi:DNA-binding MarR family transcriptional regulator
VNWGARRKVTIHAWRNFLRSHDVTYPQYAVLDHIMRNGTKAETISQISDAVEVLQPAVTKIASDPTSSAK